jgi:hypothetical protein
MHDILRPLPLNRPLRSEMETPSDDYTEFELDEGMFTGVPNVLSSIAYTPGKDYTIDSIQRSPHAFLMLDMDDVAVELDEFYGEIKVTGLDATLTDREVALFAAYMHVNIRLTGPGSLVFMEYEFDLLPSKTEGHHHMLSKEPKDRVQAHMFVWWAGKIGLCDPQWAAACEFEGAATLRMPGADHPFYADRTITLSPLPF